MSEEQKPTMEESVHSDTEAWTETKEVLEQPSDIDTSFFPEDSEVLEKDGVTAAFVEPTEEQLPKEEVPMAQQGYIGKDYFGDDEWEATTIGEFPMGGILSVVKDKTSSFYRLKKSNGSVAQQYAGMYTSYDRAEKAAREYLAATWEERNAKATG